MQQEVQYIQISIEALIGIGVTMGVATFAGAWALLNEFVKTPVKNLTDQLIQTNVELRELTKTVSNAQTDISVLNQWRADTDRRITRLEET